MVLSVCVCRCNSSAKVIQGEMRSEKQFPAPHLNILRGSTCREWCRWRPTHRRPKGLPFNPETNNEPTGHDGSVVDSVLRCATWTFRGLDLGLKFRGPWILRAVTTSRGPCSLGGEEKPRPRMVSLVRKKNLYRIFQMRSLPGVEGIGHHTT